MSKIWDRSVQPCYRDDETSIHTEYNFIYIDDSITARMYRRSEKNTPGIKNNKWGLLWKTQVVYVESKSYLMQKT